MSEESTTTPNDQQKPNPPPPSETEHILSDLHKEKARRQELEAKLKSVEERELESSKQWETLAKRREDEVKALEQRLNSQTEAIIMDRKMSVVREAALRAGLRREALEDLELQELRGITVETTSQGRINVHGADSFVQDLKTRKPWWFSSNDAPAVNSSAPEVLAASGQVTVDVLRKLEQAAKKTPAHSPEWKQYEAAIRKYKAAQ